MKKYVTLTILVVIAALIFWFFYALRSYFVMGIYSSQHAKNSVMHESGFAIEMPSGKGWYPFVMTYNAHGFGEWADVDADMSIMYNFGAFDVRSRTSLIYDETSSKYSSFYGAYAVKKSEDDFGFLDNGDIDMDEVSLAVEYDYTQLVIRDFGCEMPMFEVEDYTITPDIVYAGSVGWVRIDAVIAANGAAHNYLEYQRPYLQYGRPMEQVETDFEVIPLFGRVYAKYFDEYDCTVMVYVIAPAIDTVQECDEHILANTVIGDK